MSKSFSNLPARLDLFFTQGGSENMQLAATIINCAGTVVSILDLTGWAAQLEIRNVPQGTILYDTLSTTNGRIVLGGIAGTITMLWTEEETQNYPFTCAYYDLKMIDPSGNVGYFIGGNINIAPTVTEGP